MEKVKSSYETMFIVDSSKGEDAVAATVAKFKSLIEANGEIETFNEWLQKHGLPKITRVYAEDKDGNRLFLEKECFDRKTLPAIAELERIFNITEDIMRSMTVKVA